MEKLLGGSVVDLMSKALGAYSLRQKAISNNIANANTPGYKRVSVLFEDAVRDAMRGQRLGAPQISSDRVNNISPTISTDQVTESRYDGNNVNIDIEMAELAKNSMNYEAITKILNSNFGLIRFVINSGR